MENGQNNRRDFLKNTLSSAAGMVLMSGVSQEIMASATKIETISSPYIHRHLAPKIKFAVIGMNHAHIYSQVEAVIRGGGELVSFYAKEADLVANFAKKYPNAKLASSETEILEDKSIQLVLSSIIANERAPLGIRVMKHGKDYMSDKPGITTLEQLAEVRKVQKATKRIYSIMYSERFENKATVKAGELVKAGAIGKVVQTIGLGPHRINANSRPAWFFDKKQFGGILCDIGSHQCDQFLFFTGSTKAEVVASQIANVNHPQYPLFEDFGDVMLRGNEGSGYVRVDWFTPDGLKTWGDGRLTILGTEGYIEIRKNIDIATYDHGNNLYLVNNKETKYIDCSNEFLPYGEQLVNDIVNRTETAMTQEHCFLATELSIKAQTLAHKLTKA
ncbi:MULTISPECIES: Gfo/Idh/MocA family oxidoreductase [unclassified Arcicella]|uniref:Gfo/Idh/MocA family protein n=1 Tax=unclassified Arcicella TaxID=2644986 RepID=UPI002865B6C9|nr:MULTISPECIES: Gfo/Idh/MocA family oxidoreductase [unclassified Arcicella]MDR6561927.1 putative dehydrogenase [Arcicella sp. BE51]MDR6811798.1 putative dehydrogenase [Arcicella sp. BE140]MDR6822828.1 putative dehydrogenase [Arcicella sp. BE139]